MFQARRDVSLSVSACRASKALSRARKSTRNAARVTADIVEFDRLDSGPDSGQCTAENSLKRAFPHSHSTMGDKTLVKCAIMTD